MSNALAPPDACNTEVNGRVNDPREHYARDAANTNHIIINVYDILTHNQRSILGELTVEFLEDLGQGSMLCRYEPSDLEPLRKLDFVRQVDVYRNKYKIPANLLTSREVRDAVPEDITKQFTFDAFVHADISDIPALAYSLASRYGFNRASMIIGPNQIRLEAPDTALEDIVADDRIRILEEVAVPVLHDDEAKKIILALEMQDHLEYQGAGQTIAVYDSGFDLGTIDDCHPAFTGKIKKLVPIARASDMNLTEAQRVDDPHGHGTHVCGTIVGREILTSHGQIGGVAQDAQLVLSSLEAVDGELLAPLSLSDLFSTAYHESDARVFSNSWGDGLLSGSRQKKYGESAKSVDVFVRQYPDAFVVFSAGNNNTDLPVSNTPTIGSQAAAKNCMTVGASGSTRHSPGTPIDKTEYLNPNQVVGSSSRGPTYEKRNKPDVVAPGFSVFSAHSRHIRARNFVGQEAISSEYPEAKWMARTGTSHAAPLVSGCAALLRGILSERHSSPPAALLKAVLINGAIPLSNVDREAQGFGRIDLASSILMLQTPPLEADKISSSTVTQSAGTLIGRPLAQDEVFELSLPPALSPAKSQLKVTMVYNDLSGALLQNNLNLAVINSETKEIKHGGEFGIDKQNNIEQVVWGPVPHEPLLIRVTAQKIFPKSPQIPNPEQDFALAWMLSISVN